MNSASADGGGRPWRILSLDGGGVRGLAELLILQRIFNTMETIIAEELGVASQSLRPCDFFDLIGGTSTGGLVALLIGRLKMSIPEATATFKSLSERIFPSTKGNWFSKRVALATARTIYDATVFESEVQKVLLTKTGDSEMRMLEDNPRCRVFVCATRMHTTSSIILRTYAPRDPGQANHSVKIWQAARATSAAPPLFDPITIDDCGMTLLDGAFRLNNPINETLSEACDLDPHREFGCIVSIGTGLADVPALENSRSLLKVAQACVQISLDCEEVAAKFIKGPTGRQVHEGGRYFRFNVPRRLHAVGIDDWEKHSAVQEYVETYLESMGPQLDKCARKLLVHSGYAISPFPPQTRRPPPPSRPSIPQLDGTPINPNPFPTPKSSTTLPPYQPPPKPTFSDTATISHLSIGSSAASISSLPLTQPALPLPTTSPSLSPVSTAIESGTSHLSSKSFPQAYDAFKLALSLLKPLPPIPANLPLFVAAHLGMADALIQAAAAKQKNVAKAMAHLKSAEGSVTKALGYAKMSGDKINMKRVELELLVLAIMKAETEAQGERVDGVMVGCLGEGLEGFIGSLDVGTANANGDSKGDGESMEKNGDRNEGKKGNGGNEEELRVLRIRAEAWMGRLRVKHGVAELG
ncbi:hypothetical protein OQA88_12086 [Cercophora sp. LCS_1]